MEILRTPDERFSNLPGYSFEPHYLELGQLRMHYVDEGPRQGPLWLLLHGEPSWSYLYRKMIAPLAAAGFRVVAPDLIGFGKSDKPTDPSVYTYQSHLDWLRDFVLGLNLQDISMFCQDWGGLLGLRLAAEHGDRFRRIAAGNTFLPAGDTPAGEAFLAWRKFSQEVKRLPISKIISGSCVSKLSSEVIAAYNAPFPDENYKIAARKFPLLVPISEDDPAVPGNRLAWQELRRWQKPFLTLFSDSDPVTRGGDLYFRRHIPGCKKQPHTTIKDAGHFLQEDKGEEIAERLLAWDA
ncbi:MAG: haloalkane dehalogenase [Leptospirales bacterium]|nr:haloalkane dehalogenase [Leptospirales bacterium]